MIDGAVETWFEPFNRAATEMVSNMQPEQNYSYPLPTNHPSVEPAMNESNLVLMTS